MKVKCWQGSFNLNLGGELICPEQSKGDQHPPVPTHISAWPKFQVFTISEYYTCFGYHVFAQEVAAPKESITTCSIAIYGQLKHGFNDL